MLALGLMSGTSLDGIDVALLRTDGEGAVERLGGATFPYDDAMRQRLRQGLAEATAIERRGERPGTLRQVEHDLTLLHAEAVASFLAAAGTAALAIDCIGFHGQTVLHRPERRLTVQIGDGALLAERTGIDVVHDLRAADVAAGGQGAPLVPVYHRALIGADAALPVAVLNIGGVANLTYIGPDRGLLAFDTGPGNALVDDWVFKHSGRRFDDGGGLAATGSIDDQRLARFLATPYFDRPPPKSLDRQAFADCDPGGLSLADGAATLTAFSAAAVARSLSHLPAAPERWIVAGGGRRNGTLMGMLTERLAGEVVAAEAAGLDGDTMEAEAWAYLAVRSLAGLPITFPATTGVPRPLSGGLLARAPRRRRAS